MKGDKIEIIQINISGEDKPGLTSSLTGILARHDAFILDIGQSNIHQSLTLGILFMTTPERSGQIMKELLFKASEMNITIRFEPVTEEQYRHWVTGQGKHRYIVTLVGRRITAEHISRVTKLISDEDLNIDAMNRLTGRMPLDEDERAPKTSIEFSVRGNLSDKARFQNELMKIANSSEIDISFQRDGIFRRSRRLICFDMDSTLITTEVIDELAERAGVGDEVKQITERAMRGEIDFRESFTERVALSTSSTSGSTATVAAEVCILPPDSVTGTLCTRCVPLSNFNLLYAPEPITVNVHSLMPPISVSLMSTSSIRQPMRSAYLEYILKSSAPKSAASSPPVPLRISTITFLLSLGSLGISIILSFSSRVATSSVLL